MVEGSRNLQPLQLMALVYGGLLACGCDVPGADLSQHGAEGSGCAEAVDVPVGSFPDLLSRLLAIDEGPGSATAPLPLKQAYEAKNVCVDEQGDVWSYNDASLAHYDQDLEIMQTFGATAGATLACSNDGALLVSPTQVTGATGQPTVSGFVVRRYTALEGKVGEWNFAEGKQLFVQSVMHRHGWTAVQVSLPALAATTIFRIDPTMQLDGAPLQVSPDLVDEALALGNDGELIQIVREPVAQGPVPLDLEIAPVGAAFEARGTITQLAQDRGYYAQVRSDPQGNIVIAGRNHLAVPTEPNLTVATPQIYLIAASPDAQLLWSREFASPGQLNAPQVNIDSAGSIWFTARFEEWAQTGQQVVWGHRSAGLPLDWEHNLLALIGSDGEVSKLLPVGNSHGWPVRVLPLNANEGIFEGQVGSSFGLDGALPAYRTFIAKLELPEAAPEALPLWPQESLKQWQPHPAAGEVVLDQVHRAGDGAIYLCNAEDGQLRLVSYPDGTVLPLFTFSPSDRFTFEINQDQLFWFDWGDLYTTPPSFSVYQRTDDGWSKTQDLALGTVDLNNSEAHYGAILATNDWLFLSALDRVLAYPRRADVWGDPITLPGVGTSLARIGDSLFVGDPSVTDQRRQAGGVHSFTLSGGAFIQNSTLTASDPLPYEPALPPSGDVGESPPIGKEFGLKLTVEGETLVVSNRPGQAYFFEQRSGQWQETDRIDAGGIVRMLGSGQLVAAAPTESRGVTLVSGALRFFSKQAGLWREQRRVVPSQRWMSEFGSTMELADDGTLLVGAPGYGSAEYGKGGAVFLLPPSGCK